MVQIPAERHVPPDLTNHPTQLLEVGSLSGAAGPGS